MSSTPPTPTKPASLHLPSSQDRNREPTHEDQTGTSAVEPAFSLHQTANGPAGTGDGKGPVLTRHHIPSGTAAAQLITRTGLDTDLGLPPVRRQWFRLSRLLGGLVILGLVAGVGVLVASWLGVFDNPYKDLEFHRVDRGDIILTAVQWGELESARNTEIVCKVRSSGRGNNIATTIKWVIPDGSHVRKGDLICLLDDSALKEQYTAQEIVVAEKHALLVQAEKDREIVLSQNKSDLENAENNVRLAEIDLKKFLEGDIEQKRKDVLGRISLAESELAQWRDRFSWTMRMVKLGYMSVSQAQSDESRLRSAQIALEKLLEEKRVLEEYEFQRGLIDYQNKLAQAKAALAVVRTQAEAKAAQAEATYKSRLSIYEQELRKLEELAEDIRNCTIYAPNDGLVIYYVPETSRWGIGSQQVLIQENEPVREGQRLMRIPDLRRMQVRVKIHESLVSRIRGDVIRRTGFSDTLFAALAVTPSHWTKVTTLMLGPKMKEEYSELEEEVVRPGLRAQIRIPDYPRPIQGHVKSVAAVASSTDFLSSDVKVYQTIVAVDEEVPNLRPGMSAEVTIYLEGERENVLRLPIHAVLEVNGKKFCYVKNEQTGEIEKRSIRTGVSNNRWVEILPESELREGELVVLNPRTLAERRGDLVEMEERRAPRSSSPGKPNKSSAGRADALPAAGNGDATAQKPFSSTDGENPEAKPKPGFGGKPRKPGFGTRPGGLPPGFKPDAGAVSP
jgi:HlyD family secretion protein